MDLNEIFGYLASLLIGLTLGLIGAGGFMTLPILIYLFHIPLKSAIPISLLVCGISSLIASFNHWKNKNIDLKTIINFILFSLTGSVTGGLCSSLIPDKIKIGLFILLMLLGGISMLSKKEEIDKNLELKRNSNIILIILIAFTIGFLTGLLGVSGGFMIIPALTILLNYPIKKAIGNSLIIISLNSLSGFLGNIQSISLINWKFAFLFISLASLGGFIGSYLNKYIQPQKLQKLLACLLISLSLFMICKEFIFDFHLKPTIEN
jgi:uncharacterized protein